MLGILFSHSSLVLCSQGGKASHFMLWFLCLCWGCVFLCHCVVECSPPWLFLMLRVFAFMRFFLYARIVGSELRLECKNT